jgi:hypothetical protein
MFAQARPRSSAAAALLGAVSCGQHMTSWEIATNSPCQAYAAGDQNHGSRSRIGAFIDLDARVGSKYSRRCVIFSPLARRNTTYSWR